MLFPQIEQSNYVPPEGNLDAQFVIVGEAPGVDEMRMKRPWVGAAGSLLMELLDNAGIRRSHCYLTNVIKERPDKNNISHFIKLPTRGQPIITEKAKQYIDQLKAELEQTTANIIIAAGNISLYALTGLTNVGKRRGSVYESTLLPGRKVLAMLHPSAALRNFMFRRYISIDLTKAVMESEFPEIRSEKRELKIFPTFREAMDFLKQIKKAKEPVAADIEVVNEEVSHISLAINKHFAMSIAFYKDRKNFFTQQEEQMLWAEIAEILEDKNRYKIFQNGSFDAWFLFRKYGIVIQPIIDTMIAMAFAFPDFPKGLDFLCSVFTDMPYYKDEGKKHMKIVVDEAEFSRYSAKDSIVLPEIIDKLKDNLKQQDNWDYFLEHCKLIPALTYMQERGILIDKDALGKMKEESTKELGELEARFKEISGMPNININSTDQMKNYFYVNLGIKPFTKAVKKADGTRESTITIDEKALKRLAAGSKNRAPREEAKILLRYRKIKKLSSTYYDMKIDRDNRIRTSLNPVGTRYSRLSSSKNIFGTGANLQNQPHSMKPFFIADPGYLMVNFDLSQADWRVVAYLAQDFNMIDALEKKKDIHRRTASMIFNKPEDQISNVDGSAPQFGSGEHSERFWGKKTNHSMNYDISPNEFALQMQIPLHQAKTLRSKYLSGYPGIEGTFWESIRNQLSKNRTITNLFGRSYMFLDRWGSDLFKAAYAYIPQSTVADVINRWGLLYIYYRQDLFKEIELLMQVHDSILYQVPVKDNFRKIAGQMKLIKARLETPLEYRGKRFSIPADFEIGFNWGNMTSIVFDGTEDEQIEKFWKG